MSKKGMEAWIMVSIGLMLLILLVVLMIISKAGNESGTMLSKIFNLF